MDILQILLLIFMPTCLELTSGLDLRMTSGMDMGRKRGMDMGVGTGIDIGVGIGIDMGLGTGMNMRKGKGTGMNMDVGAGMDMGMESGMNKRKGKGNGINMGVGTGMDMRMGSGMNMRKGKGTGMNMDVGAEMNMGMGSGMNMRKGKGTGMNMGVGTGMDMRMDMGMETGMGLRAGINNMGTGSEMDMGLDFNRKIEYPEPHPSLPQGNEIKDEWFDQKLDHSKESDTTTWKQRFFRNEMFYKQAVSQNITDMPIFVFIGGESAASPSWMRGGNWIGLAIQHKALLFMLEHRFYGKSQPTEDVSLTNIAYLTSHQALADLANFIQSMRKEYGLTSANKVVCFGGSYSGALAAWMRIRYPGIVHAAVASSAPVQPKVDYFEYFDVVMKSMETLSSSKCTNTVKEAMAQMTEMSKTKKGCDKLKELFSLCYPLNPRNKLDVQMFFTGQGQKMAGPVQSYKPGQARPGTMSVADVCNILEDENEPDALKRYIKLNDAFWKGQCVPFYYADYTYSLGSSTTWDSKRVAAGNRQWIWQTCNEFGQFQISDDKDALLNKTVPTSLFTQQCGDIFTKGFTDEVIRKRVDFTNKGYKGKFKARNVCYVQGSIDPWQALGIDEKQGAIVIEGVSHCADMDTPLDSDIPTLKAGRKKIAECLDEVLKLK